MPTFRQRFDFTTNVANIPLMGVRKWDLPGDRGMGVMLIGPLGLGKAIVDEYRSNLCCVPLNGAKGLGSFAFVSIGFVREKMRIEQKTPTPWRKRIARSYFINGPACFGGRFA